MLKTIYNVYFRHRGIPAKFRFAASDWTYWKLHQSGIPYMAVADLHRELGTTPHVIVNRLLGPVIRIQPNHILFNDVNAIEDIHGYNTKTHKSEFYSSLASLTKYPPSLFAEVYLPIIWCYSDFQEQSSSWLSEKSHESIFRPNLPQRLRTHHESIL